VALQLALRIGGGESSAASAAARRERATAAIERAVGRGLGGSLRVVGFRAALAASQRYYVVRENMRYHADYFLARLRALVLALGVHFAARGTVETPIDLCFLSLEEIATALDDGTSLAPLVAERRAAHTRDAVSPPPDLLRDGAAVPDRAPRDTLSGEIAAPGRCVATARVVRTSADFAAVEQGCVLVARYTDPGWTPILELAAGLVLESGGQLSHGAIVARELGIPALVNVAGALDAIRSGDRVDLDAMTGWVRIVERG
jgi:phosphohistidine swiveling domain-containing protein